MFFFRFLERHKYFTSFIILSVTFFIHLVTSGKTYFYCDAGQYWSLGSSFVKDGSFSILNYSDALRGLWLPFIFFVLQFLNKSVLLDPLLVVRIFSAIYISGFIAVLIPKLISKIYPDVKISIKNILIFGLLIFIFWRNYFNYSLSDFPAIILLFWGIYFLISERKISWIISGLLVGIAINIRPIYLISLLPIFVSFFLVREKKTVNIYFSFLKKAIFFIIGVLVVLTPQAIINKKAFDTISPLVQTQKSVYGKDLYLQQLIWGLTYEKYETNMGNSYPKAQVYFVDRLGNSIVQNENVGSITNYRDFLGIYLKYPVEMSCIYLKHIFNSIDIKSNSPFLKDVNRRNYIFSLINYSIFFTFFLVIFFLRKNLFNSGIKILFPIIIIIPALLSIPTAVESRFLLPVFLYVYLSLSFLVDYKSLFMRFLKSKKTYIFILYAAFLLICFILSNSTFSNLEII